MGRLLNYFCTWCFTVVSLGLHGMCGPVSEQQMDRSRGSYIFDCFHVSFSDGMFVK